MHANGAPGATMADEFWRFSQALYACGGVAERCLRLQDRDGWDVNLALFCLWVGLTRGALAAERLDEASALAEAWGEVAIVPLRHVRRALKTGLDSPGADRLGVEAFRGQVKRIELLAEERLQRALAPIAEFADAPPGRKAAEAALAHVSRRLASRGRIGEQTSGITGGNEAEDLDYLLAAAEDFVARGD